MAEDKSKQNTEQQQEEETKVENTDTNKEQSEKQEPKKKTYTAEDIANMTDEEIDELKFGSDKKEDKEEENKEPKKTREEIAQEQSDKQEVVLNKIIQGVNDVFEKDYNFEELDLKFTIKARLPNVKEQTRIRNLTDDLLDGRSLETADAIYYQYFMLATLLVTGIDVPKMFRDPDKIYTLSPLLTVYLDFVEYANSFRY